MRLTEKFRGAGRSRPRQIAAITSFTFVLLASLAIAAPGPAAPKDADPWAPLRPLVGTWRGAVDGKLGTGEGLRRYEFIVGGKYLMSRHSSVRLPQEKSPEGDQHEEIGVFSFDRERQVIVFRAFMIEGFVNRYTCEAQPGKLVCLSEAVESGPGTRARLVFELGDRYRFVEHCDIGWPGRDLERYFTIQWTRAPALSG